MDKERNHLEKGLEVGMRQYTLVQKILLRKAFPIKLILDCVGLIWGIYFLWNHNWIQALSMTAGFSILGTIVALGQPLSRLAQTSLGKLMLVHSHPFNLFFHLIGWILLIKGIWQHDAYQVLLAVSAVLLGHMFGWEIFFEHQNTSEDHKAEYKRDQFMRSES